MENFIIMLKWEEIELGIELHCLLDRNIYLNPFKSLLKHCTSLPEPAFYTLGRPWHSTEPWITARRQELRLGSYNYTARPYSLIGQNLVTVGFTEFYWVHSPKKQLILLIYIILYFYHLMVNHFGHRSPASVYLKYCKKKCQILCSKFGTFN